MTVQTPTELARSLRGQPSADWQDEGLCIDLSWRLRLGAPGQFGASISRRRSTASGREGKPVHVLTLMADTPAEVLRQVADLLDPEGPEITDP